MIIFVQSIYVIEYIIMILYSKYLKEHLLFVSANVEDFCFLDDDSICIGSSTLEEFSEMNNCDNERLSGEHII